MTIERRVGAATVRFTGRAEGDLGHGGAFVTSVRDDVAARRRAVVDLPWTWLRQVHGDEVVRVDAPGAGAGATADAAVTDQRGAALAVLTADCAPVVLASSSGAVGVVHAGWAGLLAGVVAAAVKELRALGAQDLEAVLGPCIHAECYEFGLDNLVDLTDRYGPSVAARTAAGELALDLPAAVKVALVEQGIADVDDVGVCTACSATEYYSWRARRETERQATVVWQ
ncbi:MAG: polyphenol oxidase family protein [Acidimicrobiia bacterium]